MKVRSNSYELHGLNGNYNSVVEAFKSDAMMHSVVDNREQFYMPGGKVTLQLRRVDDKTFLDVTRTTLFQPRYVGNLIEQLDGEWSGGSDKRGVSPDKTVELFTRK